MNETTNTWGRSSTWGTSRQVEIEIAKAEAEYRRLLAELADDLHKVSQVHLGDAVFGQVDEIEADLHRLLVKLPAARKAERALQQLAPHRY